MRRGAAHRRGVGGAREGLERDRRRERCLALSILTSVLVNVNVPLLNVKLVLLTIPIVVVA